MTLFGWKSNIYDYKTMLDHEISNSDFAWKATGHSDNMNWNFHDLPQAVQKNQSNKSWDPTLHSSNFRFQQVNPPSAKFPSIKNTI